MRFPVAKARGELGLKLWIRESCVPEMEKWDLGLGLSGSGLPWL